MGGARTGPGSASLQIRIWGDIQVWFKFKLELAGGWGGGRAGVCQGHGGSDHQPGTQESDSGTTTT